MKQGIIVAVKNKYNVQIISKWSYEERRFDTLMQAVAFCNSKDVDQIINKLECLPETNYIH